MCTNGLPGRGSRYARDILALQERLNFRSLHDMPADRAIYAARRPNGFLTLGLRTDQLTDRHLLGLQGFRLAQYLQLGWVCEDVIASQGMFCEPVHGLRPDDLHMVTISPAGEILGYLGLVGSSDDTPMDLSDPGRRRFPVEEAHGINLFDIVPGGAATTDQVRELKRFVHRRSMTDRGVRLRVTLELLLAAGTMIAGQDDARYVVGDVEEHVALRHLMMVGLEIRLIEGTQPELNTTHYLHHAYTKRAVVRPFVAAVPPADVTRERMFRLHSILSSTDPSQGTRELVANCMGTVLRVAA